MKTPIRTPLEKRKAPMRLNRDNRSSNRSVRELILETIRETIVRKGIKIPGISFPQNPESKYPD